MERFYLALSCLFRICCLCFGSSISPWTRTWQNRRPTTAWHILWCHTEAHWMGF